MKNRKLSDALDNKNQSSFKLQEQEGSVRRYFPKTSKIVLNLLKKHKLDL